jgi:hypothetical protein
MAMAGAIGGAQWRSRLPAALRYGVNVDSTPLARAHGISRKAEKEKEGRANAHSGMTLLPAGGAFVA